MHAPSDGSKESDRHRRSEKYGDQMNIYHAWCDLKLGVSDIVFYENASRYLDHLRAKGMIESWRITRRKLGLAPLDLGEFHLMIEVKDLAQLDRAFDHVAERSEPTEGLHFGANSTVQNVRFALYRDFLDPQRQQGAERF
jgi:hypothetical protein